MTKEVLQSVAPILLDKHTFFFDTPLYDEIALTSVVNENSRLKEEFLSGTVDAYSAKNHIETTYTIKSWDVDDYYDRGFGNFYKVMLSCVRKPGDNLYFFIGVTSEVLIKVGQYPSLADLSFGEIGKKYDKHLGREDMKEFKKAVGLAAHGVGAGSFVYLRRIFEKQIDETYEATKSTLFTEHEDYQKFRMDEKVGLLKDHLPSK